MAEAKVSTEKGISQRVDDDLEKQLCEEANCETDKARLKTVGIMPHAGDWLNAKF